MRKCWRWQSTKGDNKAAALTVPLVFDLLLYSGRPGVLPSVSEGARRRGQRRDEASLSKGFVALGFSNDSDLNIWQEKAGLVGLVFCCPVDIKNAQRINK